ncbi:MAG: Rpn family recombination-promoting nuclease/putative transposase [Desulfococcaceae bacterium]|nr:Rpn family recombination-promoting nuclease/putative transposase [Desulfococcaceae bacterium]
MQEITNPHDRFFRETFTRKDIAENFLDVYLPEEIRGNIQLSTLSPVKDSFVDKELREHFSDILYTVKYRETDLFIYLLFEHKSFPDRFAGFQFFRYKAKIWEQYLKQNPKAKKLPPVFPMLLCHGKTEWNIPLNFQALIQKEEFPDKYIPEFHYELYDISHIPEAEIRGKVLTRMVLLTARHIFDPDIRHRLPEILSLFHEVADQNTALEMLEIILRYVVRAVNRFDEKDVIEIIKDTEIGEDIMETFIDRYRF